MLAAMQHSSKTPQLWRGLNQRLGLLGHERKLLLLLAQVLPLQLVQHAGGPEQLLLRVVLLLMHPLVQRSRPQVMMVRVHQTPPQQHHHHRQQEQQEQQQHTTPLQVPH